MRQAVAWDLEINSCDPFSPQETPTNGGENDTFRRRQPSISINRVSREHRINNRDPARICHMYMASYCFLPRHDGLGSFLSISHNRYAAIQGAYNGQPEATEMPLFQKALCVIQSSGIQLRLLNSSGQPSVCRVTL